MFQKELCGIRSRVNTTKPIREVGCTPQRSSTSRAHSHIQGTDTYRAHTHKAHTDTHAHRHKQSHCLITDMSPRHLQNHLHRQARASQTEVLAHADDDDDDAVVV